MDIRQLRDFLSVVKAGSFAAASRDLNVSQPGLGYQIKQLEQELSVSLLVRHSRGVELTRAGEVFLHRAEAVLAMVSQIPGAVKQAAGDEALDLKLGLSPTPEHLLGPAFTALSGPGGPIRLSFREGLSSRLIQDVRTGALDAAICVAPSPIHGLTPIPLYREFLHLIGPPDEDPGDIAFAQLPRFPLMLGPREHVARQVVEHAAERAGLALDITQELEPGGLRRSLILHGAGYTVAACSLFHDDLAAGTLMARRIVEPSLWLDVSLVCNGDLRHSLEKLLLATAQAAIPDRPGMIEPAVAVHSRPNSSVAVVS